MRRNAEMNGKGSSIMGKVFQNSLNLQGFRLLIMAIFICVVLWLLNMLLIYKYI